MSWIKGEKHPWEVAVERLKKNGKPITPENVRRELDSHGYYLKLDHKTILVRDNPRIVAVSPDLFSILAGRVRKPKKHIKPINYLPEADLRLTASVIAYNVAKDLFGEDLRAFAVVGGSLTPNIAGVPVKGITEQKRPLRKRLKARTGVVDDLDVVVVLGRPVETSEVRTFLERFYRKLSEMGIPKDGVVLDDSRPFIIYEKDWEHVAHFFHPTKPVAFFEGREHIKGIIESMMASEEGRRLLNKEMRMYGQKLDYYNKIIPQRLRKAFLQAISTKTELNPEEKKLAEMFETLYWLVDSKPVRRIVDELLLKYSKKVDTQRLRYALAKMLRQYLEIAQSVVRASREDIEKYYQMGMRNDR